MLYEQALDCGIPVGDFWNYSPLEIRDMCASYYRTKRQEIKRQITHDFIMAEVKTRYLSLKKGDEPPHTWDYYPVLFKDEQQTYVKHKEQEEFEAYKESRRNYIAEFNKRMRQG